MAALTHRPRPYTRQIDDEIAVTACAFCEQDLAHPNVACEYPEDHWNAPTRERTLTACAARSDVQRQRVEASRAKAGDARADRIGATS